jgi:hypothetical protein
MASQPAKLRFAHQANQSIGAIERLQPFLDRGSVELKNGGENGRIEFAALLGFDHTKLTYRFQGRDFRLTDVHSKLVTKLLA